MAYKNKADQIAASRRHYLANKEYYLERNRRYRKELSTYINNIKEKTPCSDCGKNYPYYVMDFDHLEGHIKDGLVSFFTKTGRIEAMKMRLPSVRSYVQTVIEHGPMSEGYKITKNMYN